MPTSLTAFKAEALDALLALLWKQWSALGVAGQSGGRVSDASTVSDPEALLLLTMHAGRYDARLFDEVLDWLSLNGHALNAQRLKNLQKHYGFSGEALLGAVANVLLRRNPGDLKWKSLAGLPKQMPAQPLFFHLDGVPLPTPATCEALFAEYGFLRGEIHARGLSSPFPRQDTAALLLRLRSLMGTSLRCELLVLLAAHKELSVKQVAEGSGYLPRSVYAALTEMAQSGVIQAYGSGKRVFYRLRPGVLDALLCPGGKPIMWRPWAALFRALDALLVGLEQVPSTAASPLLQAAQARGLSEQIQPYLDRAGRPEVLGDIADVTGEGYTEAFIAAIRQVVRQLAAG